MKKKLLVGSLKYINLIYGVSMDKEIFSKVLGYEGEKKELLLIRSWILNENIISNDKLTIPKGILFYGQPVYIII